MPGDIETILDWIDLKMFENSIQTDRTGYHSSYQPLLDAVSRLMIQKDSVAALGIAHLCYGWMPATLRNVKLASHNQSVDLMLEAVRIAKTPEDATSQLALWTEESPINRSWIGASKFLHFINPEVFPIWDRHIAGHCGYGYQYQYNTKTAYLSYVEEVHQALKHPVIPGLQHVINARFGYSPTKVRAVEVALINAALL